MKGLQLAWLCLGSFSLGVLLGIVFNVWAASVPFILLIAIVAGALLIEPTKEADHGK